VAWVWQWWMVSRVSTALDMTFWGAVKKKDRERIREREKLPIWGEQRTVALKFWKAKTSCGWHSRERVVIRHPLLSRGETTPFKGGI